LIVLSLRNTGMCEAHFGAEYPNCSGVNTGQNERFRGENGEIGKQRLPHRVRVREAFLLVSTVAMAEIFSCGYGFHAAACRLPRVRGSWRVATERAYPVG